MDFDLIVVGAGHAGIEAALAGARSGCSTLMLTMDADSVGKMSCNPAIGGIGKGHLVREVDALGGEMGRAIDECGIQFRRLNTRKGPAVRASRAQADKARYARRMKRAVTTAEGLCLGEEEVVALVTRGDRVVGVRTREGNVIKAGAVVLTTGTFMGGVMHTGEDSQPGGRAGDRASMGLSASLAELGLELGRLKTGTCPRLDTRSIDYSRLEEQPGDEVSPRFSFGPPTEKLAQISCHITYTNPLTHRIIEDNIDKSAMYNGSISSRGPRYCPSIEDKVMKFPLRDRHRIFLEPEGLDTVEVYPNGLSTALPASVQRDLVASIAGLENAEMIRAGYAIEYEYVVPTQLDSGLAARWVRGLFLAGQINGTTGYEEAAAQGLIAGINAARFLRDEGPFLLERSQAYIGVLIDDLINRGIDGEPYRMFTSRAEYRLLLREDNADLRLADKAREAGLLDEDRRCAVETKRDAFEAGLELLRATSLTPSQAINAALGEWSVPPLGGPTTAYKLLGRPGADFGRVAALCGIRRFGSEVEEQLTTEARYDGYIARQKSEIERMSGLEAAGLPEALDYTSVEGLSSEVREKLSSVRPENLGQASRISGVTPAALSALAVHLKKRRAV